MAALLAGQSVSQVADEYDIPRSTVANWSAKVNQAGVPTVPDTKREEVGELLLEYLRTNLEALTAQAKVFADERWIRQQGASEAAVLHGILTDKSIRLLEAMARAQTERMEA